MTNKEIVNTLEFLKIAVLVDAKPMNVNVEALDLAIKALEERPQQGKWIKETDERLKGKYRCSECGRRVDDLLDDIRIHAGGEDYTISDLYPYCHCGADMRPIENSEDVI